MTQMAENTESASVNENEPPPEILQFFQFGHLPPHLQAVSKEFWHMATGIVDTIPPGERRTDGGPAEAAGVEGRGGARGNSEWPHRPRAEGVAPTVSKSVTVRRRVVVLGPDGEPIEVGP
jgi:hypothetical protein